MNEENNFSIDVKAEMQSLNFDDSILDSKPSEFITIQPDEKLMELVTPTSMEVDAPLSENQNPNILETEKLQTQVVSLSEQDFISVSEEKFTPQRMDVTSEISENIRVEAMPIEAQLTDPVIIESSEVGESQQLAAQKSSANLPNMDIKMDASDAFKATQSVAKQVEDVQSGMNELANGINDSWLPPREKDEFEERPTLDTTNLVFEDRKSRIMSFPEWS